MKALLTTREAAEYIGYGKQALDASRMDGGTLSGKAPPPHVKIGTKTIRYKLTDLERWVEEL
jgi:predicted DNA-binding transcriptional regulator AlpA